MLGFSKKKPRHITTAANERVYAIGDVHGRHDLLTKLLNKIVNHWEGSERDFDRVTLIMLGDIIDRGPDSKQCLDLVERLVRRSRAILLQGNHEDLMLRSIKGDEFAQRLWLENGGHATLKSFGVEPPHDQEDSLDFGERLGRAVPERYVTLLEEAPTHAESGNYYFVHAGVKPGVPLRSQEDFDKFFIREEFTSSPDWHGAMIVHGHSIVTSIEVRPNRIAVDTGAYRTDKLSCLCLQGEMMEFLSTE